jgi:hypothetical protein
MELHSQGHYVSSEYFGSETGAVYKVTLAASSFAAFEKQSLAGLETAEFRQLLAWALQNNQFPVPVTSDEITRSYVIQSVHA